jgi:hypothetical protein
MRLLSRSATTRTPADTAAMPEGALRPMHVRFEAAPDGYETRTMQLRSWSVTAATVGPAVGMRATEVGFAKTLPSALPARFVADPDMGDTTRRPFQQKPPLPSTRMKLPSGSTSSPRGPQKVVEAPPRWR